MDNPLVVICPPDPSGRQKEHSTGTVYSKETFVVREQGSATWIAMQRFFAADDVKLKTGMQMTSNGAIKQAGEAGLGLGIVSIHTLTPGLDIVRLAVVDVKSFPILRYWYPVRRQGKRLSPVAMALRQFAFKQSKELFASEMMEPAIKMLIA